MLDNEDGTVTITSATALKYLQVGDLVEFVFNDVDAPEVGNDFALITNSIVREGAVGNPATIGITGPGNIRIEYIGKEALFSNQLFNWGALADPSVTTVVYMPKRTLRALLARAVAEGLPAATPALVVFNATRPDQAVVRAEAGDLANRVEAAGLEGPAIVMVGNALGREAQAEAILAEALPAAGRAGL